MMTTDLWTLLAALLLATVQLTISSAPDLLARRMARHRHDRGRRVRLITSAHHGQYAEGLIAAQHPEADREGVISGLAASPSELDRAMGEVMRSRGD
jgi:hypothetical protein